MIEPLGGHYRLLIPDLRGFGWSEAPGGGYSAVAFAQDTVRLLDALDPERAHVVGHDWGGLTGYLLGLQHPSRVGRRLYRYYLRAARAILLRRAFAGQRLAAPTRLLWLTPGRGRTRGAGRRRGGCAGPMVRSSIPAMSDTAILVEGLAKRFGDVVALDGIDFQVPAGTVFGLLGPNGAGKTTAIRILTTILAPDGGRAEVLGLDVVRQADQVRQSIGLAGQYAAVDPNLTGRENLRLTGRLAQLPTTDARVRADELLERFELTDAADRPARTYSGGMRRRLDVAAALVQRPPVVFLDEPTTGLDIHSRNALWEMIRELVADGTTVLLTTQYLEEADRLAQRIAVVDDGRVIANDTPVALKAQLGSTVIELGMGDADRAVQAGALLGERLAAQLEREGATIRLATDDGSRLLIDVLRQLDDHQLAPATLAVREPSMDDVFLALTGHRAEEAAAAASGPAGRRAGRRGAA